MTSNAGAPVWKNTGCPGSPAPSACMDKNGSVSASMKAQIPKLSADCWTGHLEIRTGSRGKALEGRLKNRKEPTTRVQDGHWEIRTGSPEKDQEKKTQEAAVCMFWAETLSRGKNVFPKAEPAEQTAERIQLLQILSPVRTVSRAEFPSGRGFPRHSMLKHRFLRRAHHPHIAIKSIIRIHRSPASTTKGFPPGMMKYCMQKPREQNLSGMMKFCLKRSGE